MAAGRARLRRRRGDARATPLLVGLSLAAVGVLALLQVVGRPREAAVPLPRSGTGPPSAGMATAEGEPRPARRSARRPEEAAERAGSASSRAEPRPPPPGGSGAQPAAAGPAVPRVAIVLDDCGQRLDLMERAVLLPTPVTFAVIPRLPHSRASAELAFRAGHEVIVHQPMEPEDYPATDPGEGAILVGMSAARIRDVLEDNFEDVPHAAGLNNHMGSRATADPELMAVVMAAVAGRRGPRGALYFLDSRTTADTVAWQAARGHGLAAAERSVFLDNDTEPLAIRAQLDRLLEAARQEGEAIGIGHLKPETLAVLETVLPRTAPREYRFVSASELMR